MGCRGSAPLKKTKINLFSAQSKPRVTVGRRATELRHQLAEPPEVNKLLAAFFIWMTRYGYFLR